MKREQQGQEVKTRVRPSVEFRASLRNRHNVEVGADWPEFLLDNEG